MKNRIGINLLIGLLAILLTLTACESGITVTSTTSITPTITRTVTVTTTLTPSLKDQLEVHFIDVGQGDAILIDLDETEILIDGGGKSPGVVTYINDYIDGALEVMVATHPHADHIGAVPRLKRVWPHLKVVASQMAAKIFQSEDMLKGFLPVDGAIAKIMLSKGEITELPPELDNYAFNADTVVREGDRIDLGSGVVYTVYDAPGHSPCLIALLNEEEETLVIGDATGFYVPEKDVFWPNYFYSLEAYCNSIRKLAALPARKAALSHNYVVEGELGQYFQKAMAATESYHLEMLERVRNGEDNDTIARSKADWVQTLTDAQPYNLMYVLSKLMIMRSLDAAHIENLFVLP